MPRRRTGTGIQQRGLLGDCEFAFDVAGEVRVGSLPAGLGIFEDQAFRSKCVADAVGSRARPKQLRHASEVERAALVQHQQKRVLG
jgi:hypothetical protein